MRVARTGEAGDPKEIREWARALVDKARAEGVELTGDDGLLTGLVRQVLQTGLEVELADHLGYESYDPVGRGSGNYRNGSFPKTLKTEIGEVELDVPRDRNSTFEPVTVPKRTRRLDGLGANVISLYAKGMTTGEIEAHLAEVYGTEISRETISKITDQILFLRHDHLAADIRGIVQQSGADAQDASCVQASTSIVKYTVPISEAQQADTVAWILP